MISTKKNVERKDSVMKVIIKGGEQDSNTFYYSMEPQGTSILTNEAVQSDVNKLMQLDSYETRKNNGQIKELQAEVKQIKGKLDKILEFCEDKSKTTAEVLE